MKTKIIFAHLLLTWIFFASASTYANVHAAAQRWVSTSERSNIKPSTRALNWLNFSLKSQDPNKVKEFKAALANKDINKLELLLIEFDNKKQWN